MPLVVKMQEVRFQSLDQEDALEQEMATHSSILAWKIPQTEKPSRLVPFPPSALRIIGLNREAWWVSKSQTRLK